MKNYEYEKTKPKLIISQWVAGSKEMLMSISKIEDAIKLKIGERNVN